MGNFNNPVVFLHGLDPGLFEGRGESVLVVVVLVAMVVVGSQLLSYTTNVRHRKEMPVKLAFVYILRAIMGCK